jgi:lysophospholipase L1-like esterase
VNRLLLTVALAMSLGLAACGGGSMGTAPGSVVAKASTTIFVGDSITNYWQLYSDFSLRHWTDDGVPGVTSQYCLDHFQTDVLDTHPEKVHIMVGTNDLRQGFAAEEVMANISRMVAMARAAGITPVLGTIAPLQGHEAETAKLNAALGTLNVKVINYFAVLSDGSGEYVPAYTADGLHPSEAGYAVMTSLAESSLRQKRERPRP